MACDEEIAERENMPRQTVSDLVEDFAEISRLSESSKSIAFHATDFDPPIYNIWKQQEKTAGSAAATLTSLALPAFRHILQKLSGFAFG
jgi:hypothetical protein